MKKIVSAACVAASIVLMALPYGVAMTFAPGPDERLVKYYSYFSMTPAGYGNWLPMLTALLSIAALALLLTGLKKNTGSAVKVCLALCIAFSLLSWLMFASASAVGMAVAALHAVALAFQIARGKPGCGAGKRE